MYNRVAAIDVGLRDVDVVGERLCVSLTIERHFFSLAYHGFVSAVGNRDIGYIKFENIYRITAVCSGETVIEHIRDVRCRQPLNRLTSPDKVGFVDETSLFCHPSRQHCQFERYNGVATGGGMIDNGVTICALREVLERLSAPLIAVVPANRRNGCRHVVCRQNGKRQRDNRVTTVTVGYSVNVCA